MKRPLISLASAIALVAPLALAVPATNAAPALPKEGATCTQKELWTQIPVRKVQSKKTGGLGQGLGDVTKAIDRIEATSGEPAVAGHDVRCNERVLQIEGRHMAGWVKNL